jgi:hypothetical protein
MIMTFLYAMILIFSLSPFLGCKTYTRTTSETIINGKNIVCGKCGSKETAYIEIRGKKMVAYCAKCFALMGKK